MNRCFIVTLLLVVTSSSHSVRSEELDKGVKKISYNSQIRPILSDKCFACHGPDSNKRKANLRLDLSEEEAVIQNSNVLTLNDKKKSLIKISCIKLSQMIFDKSGLDLTNYKLGIY